MFGITEVVNTSTQEASLATEIESVQTQVQALSQQREQVQTDAGDLQTAIINAGGIAKTTAQAGISKWPSWLLPAGLIGIGVYLFSRK